MTAPVQDLPLCVDLDGCLVRSDTLWESLAGLMRHRPLAIFLLVPALLAGRARLKERLASLHRPIAAELPFHEDFLQWLRDEAARGRALWLCTGAHHSVAKSVADELGIFKGVIATESLNLTGAAKANALVERFGNEGLDYAGNSSVDLQVWPHSRACILVGASIAVEEKARALGKPVQVFHPKPSAFASLGQFLRAMRLHQWAKNGLLFVPLLAAHRLDDPDSWLALVAAFVAFGLAASAIYLVNDLLDLSSDRAHPRKRNRPLACGSLALPQAMLGIPALLIASGLIAASLSFGFQVLLFVYLLLTLAYSFFLKRLALWDVATLAALYTLRVVAGAVVVAVPLSYWLLLFSVFLFFSLALIKRVAELVLMESKGSERAHGRGYEVSDLHLLQGLGLASAVACVLVLALYLQSPMVSLLYLHPVLLAGLGPILLLWLARLWLLTSRGQMHDDPLVFALTDRGSWMAGLLAMFVVFMAA